MAAIARAEEEAKKEKEKEKEKMTAAAKVAETSKSGAKSKKKVSPRHWLLSLNRTDLTFAVFEVSGGIQHQGDGRRRPGKAEEAETGANPGKFNFIIIFFLRSLYPGGRVGEEFPTRCAECKRRGHTACTRWSPKGTTCKQCHTVKVGCSHA